MLPIGAVIVDFDGTACLHDVGIEELGVPSSPVDGEPCPGWRDPT